MFSEEIGIKAGEGKAELLCDRRHLNKYGIVHGAVITAILDVAMGTLFKGYVTSSISVNFVQPAKEGPLVAEAKAIWYGKNLAYAEARAEQNGITVATALGVYFNVSRKPRH